jgi:hypothetical protein
MMDMTWIFHGLTAKYEFVFCRPLLLEVPEHPIKARPLGIPWPTPDHPRPRAVKTLPGSKTTVALGRRKRATAQVRPCPVESSILVA